MTRDVPLPVQLAAAGPARQRRWTVLIRLIMIIPHIFVLFFLNIAAGIVSFIGWWGALFTGRLPGFAYNYLSGYVRWYTRVQAYGTYLLTDQYPPFSLRDEPDYPVRIAIPPRDKLNRFAVLFRVILVIPASVVNIVVQYGAGTIVPLIAWVIALINGKLPMALHLAYTSVLRYSTRLTCYSNLLTAAYPWGLFGDGLALPDAPAEPDDAAAPDAGDEAPADAAAPGDEAPVDAAAPGDEAPIDAAAPGDEVPEDAAAPGVEVPVDAAAPSDEASVDVEAPGAEASVVVEVPSEEAPEDAETPSAEAPEDAAAPSDETPDDLAALGYAIPADEIPVHLAGRQPTDWPLLLTRNARQLLGVFIGIGIVFLGASSASSALITAGTNNVATARSASNAVSVANGTLEAALSNYQNTVQSCSNASCAETADGQLGTAFTNFADTVHGTPMPDSAVPAANALYSDATKIAQDLTQLSHLGPTVTPAQYGSTATSLGVNQTLNQLQADYSTLTTTLKDFH